MIDRFIDSIYSVIKLEIVLKGTNELFDYLMLYPSYVSILDDKIKQEIQEKELYNVAKINMKCIDLDSKGIASDYFDVDLIRMIAESGNNDIEDRRNELNALEVSFNQNNSAIKNKKNYFMYHLSRELKKLETCIKDVKKVILRQVVSLTLSSATVLTLGVYVIPKLY